MLRGATADVFTCLSEHIEAGEAQIPMLSISCKCRRSLTQVQRAIRVLEQSHYIAVKRGGSGRASCYDLVPESRRRMLLLAEELGLLERQ
jgi:hypothetical protein